MRRCLLAWCPHGFSVGVNLFSTERAIGDMFLGVISPCSHCLIDNRTTATHAFLISASLDAEFRRLSDARAHALNDVTGGSFLLKRRI